MDKVWKFLTSLRLTVVLLLFSLVLVFVGTLAQVKVGLYDAQAQYFRSLFVVHHFNLGKVDLPLPLPGGYLLGWALFINLVAAHIRRFTWTKKKIGIFVTHAGLIVLLLGQFLTERLQVEGSMRIEEGKSTNYSSSHLENELALIDMSDPKNEKVVAFPGGLVKAGAVISHPDLPFTVKVKQVFENSDPKLLLQARLMDERKSIDVDLPEMSAPNGLGKRVTVVEKPVTKKMDDRNFPAALVEIEANGQSKGEWLVTNWAADDALAAFAYRAVGPRYANLNVPQEFEVDGKTYDIQLRSVRQYKEHTIKLIDFTHEVYKGTERPKNFASLIRLTNPRTGEDREVLIKMNEPLRYNGETYYQSSFEPGDKVTVLQVVKNPVWLTPYLACSMVALGLLLQFGMHLFTFGKRQAKKAAAKDGGSGDGPKGGPKPPVNKRPAKPAKKARPTPEPVAVPRTAPGGNA